MKKISFIVLLGALLAANANASDNDAGLERLAAGQPSMSDAESRATLARMVAQTKQKQRVLAAIRADLEAIETADPLAPIVHFAHEPGPESKLITADLFENQ